jgi:hypothetical protein
MTTATMKKSDEMNAVVAEAPVAVATATVAITKKKTKKEIAAETPKVEKPKIMIADLKLPEGVIMEAKKSCVKFSLAGATKKAYLKGTQFEVTDLVASLSGRIEAFGAKLIKENHLGNSKGTIKKIQGTADLQSIIDLYFAK